MHARRMDDDDKPQPKLGPGWDRLFLRDTRTPAERGEAESNEWAQRRGRGQNNWVKNEKTKPAK